jgi:hypothetical protein
MTAVTEEEARHRGCPMKVEGRGMANCSGSYCMAWRWLKGSENASVGRGYCGLAGRP